MSRELTIAGRVINDSADAFVIAEVGNNHQGSIAKARELIAAAASCGVDAVKFQKRDLATWQALDPVGWATPYNSEHAFGDTYGEHRAYLEFNHAIYLELKQYAESLGLVFFATAFDVPSLRFLQEIGVPAIKLASASIVDYELLIACRRAGVPVIASTGGAEMDEIVDAAGHLQPAHLAILSCTATYPTAAEDMNLNVITTLRQRFPSTVIGLSDHYNGIALAPAAYVLGARIFEKHFCLHHTDKGSDQAFSLEPSGMARMVRDLKRTRLALGNGVKRRLDAEIPALVKMGRRGLVPTAFASIA